MTVDNEKEFDFLSQSLLLACLKIIRFGHNFIKWVKILLENQESCIINAGITTSYFNFEKSACQGVLFLLVKANHKIRGVIIFQYTYLYAACADETTFFLKNKNSIRQHMETFSTFSQYSHLKLNCEICEIARIGVLKSVTMAIYSMKCVDLCTDTIRIRAAHFPYNKSIQDEKNFSETIRKLQNDLKIWRMRSLTLEG